MSDEVAEITVLRSSDASTAKVEISLSSSLDALKKQISSSSLGPIDSKYQRLFHLGRELKSSGRKLSLLGIGRFGIFTVHLHSTQPETCEISSDDDEENEEIVAINQEVAEQQQDEQPNNTGEAAKQVIDLLDSDDDDDDDEVVVVAEQPGAKRQRV